MENKYKLSNELLLEILTNAKTDILDDKEHYKLLYIKEELFKALFDEYEKILQLIIDNDSINNKKAKELFVKINNINIINPSAKPVVIQGIYFLKVYSLVKDKQKILEKYLDNEFLMLKRKFWREFNRAKKNLSNEAEIKRLEEITLNNIKQYEELYNEIKNNPDKFELVYTTLPSLKEIYRPYVKFWYEGKILKSSIRKDKINIICKKDFKLPTKKDIIDKELGTMDGNIRNIFFKKK